ncbi:Hypothetical_protein [Hexamita inflata]|uniref:Hypothetical_protein n=1 Tax=Hexamita inflata TaxID=28002 RepID=A0ABP1KH55_9EUKA
MLLNLLYNGNLCKLDQETRNLIKFSEQFLEKVSVTEMENQIQHKKYTKLSQICSHLQTPWPFLKTARVSVFEQGWVSQFEVMQYACQNFDNNCNSHYICNSHYSVQYQYSSCISQTETETPTPPHFL